MRSVFVLAALSGAFTLAACSTQQTSSAGQAWQLNECNRMPDLRDRDRCVERAGESAAEYRRERQAAQKQP